MANIFDSITDEDLQNYESKSGNIFDSITDEDLQNYESKSGNIFDSITDEDLQTYESAINPKPVEEAPKKPTVIGELASEFKKTGKRVKDAIPSAPAAPAEVAAHLGSMSYGVPLTGLGHMIDLATDGKYKVGERVSHTLIYEPQTKAGTLVRDILFSPFSAASHVGQKRGDTLYDELLKEYGADDIRTSLYPAIRKTIWDMAGIAVTGKGMHTGKSKAKAPPKHKGEVPALDKTFAKDQAVKEGAAKEIEQVIDKAAIDNFREHEGPATLIEGKPETPIPIIEGQPEGLILPAELGKEKYYETPVDKTTERLGGKVQPEPIEREYGEKLKTRTVPEPINELFSHFTKNRFEADLPKQSEKAILIDGKPTESIPIIEGQPEGLILPAEIGKERSPKTPSNFLERATERLGGKVERERDVVGSKPEAPEYGRKLEDRSIPNPDKPRSLRESEALGEQLKAEEQSLEQRKSQHEQEVTADSYDPFGNKPERQHWEDTKNKNRLEETKDVEDLAFKTWDQLAKDAEFNPVAVKKKIANLRETLSKTKKQYKRERIKGEIDSLRAEMREANETPKTRIESPVEKAPEVAGEVKAEAGSDSYIGKTWDAPEGKREIVEKINHKGRELYAIKNPNSRLVEYLPKDEIAVEIKRDTANVAYHKRIAEEKRVVSDAKAKKELKRETVANTNREKSDIIIDESALLGKPKLMQGRIRKHLNKRVRNSEMGVVSWQELIESGNYIGKEVVEVPKIEYNRRKYNKMSSLKEQEAYEKRLKETKKSYRVLTKDGEYLEVSKMVYDVISTKNKSKKELNPSSGTPEKVAARTPLDTLKDINTLAGEKGSIGTDIGKLTPEQKAAYERLAGDINVIKHNAEQVGKGIKRYLVDQGFDPKVAKIIAKNSKKIPKYARSINLEKQNMSEDLKRAELDLGGSEPKKVQSWDTTGRLAKEILTDADKLKKERAKVKKAGAYESAEQAEALRQDLVNGVHELKEIIKTENPEVAAERLIKFSKEQRIVDTASGEAGRILNAHKKELSLLRLGKAVSKIVEKDGKLNERQLQDLKDLDVENPAAVKDFIKRLPDPTIGDYFMEYWYNSILSGPPTHIVNTAGNTLWLAYQVPHRALSAGLDAIYAPLRGKQRTRYLNEVVPMLAGYKTGFKKGKQAASEIMRTGKITKFEDKWMMEIGNSLGAWERSPNPKIRKVAPAATGFTRGLRAMDIWGKSIAFDAHANALARRSSNRKGLKGDARKKHERDFAQNLSDANYDSALRMADHSTFMDTPDPLTSMIIKSRNVPVVGKAMRYTVMPFVNTISNLTKRGIELTPGIGVVKEGVSRGMKRGFEKMPDSGGMVPVMGKKWAEGRKHNTPDIMAKQLEGAMLAMYILSKVEEGVITGPMPEKKSERDAWYRIGKKPWSIKVGDTWHEYRRIEPFNTVIATTAIARDKIKNAKDETTAIEIFGEVVDGIKWNIIDGNYFSGLQKVLNKHDTRKNAIPQFLASWVPASSFVRTAIRSAEAIDGGVTVRDGSEWMKAASQVIPTLSGKMPPRLDLWGNEAVVPGGIFRQWLPFKWADEIDDPVERELDSLGVYPSQPRRTVTYRGEKIKLSDEMYAGYLKFFGAGLKAMFTRRMALSTWNDNSFEKKIKILNKDRRFVGDGAKRQLNIELRKLKQQEQK